MRLDMGQALTFRFRTVNARRGLILSKQNACPAPIPPAEGDDSTKAAIF